MAEPYEQPTVCKAVRRPSCQQVPVMASIVAMNDTRTVLAMIALIYLLAASCPNLGSIRALSANEAHAEPFVSPTSLPVKVSSTLAATPRYREQRVGAALAILRDIDAEFVPIPGRRWRMAKYAVTFAQWDACVAAGGCDGYRPDDHSWGRAQRPVINVSRDDAVAFIGRLEQVTKHRYRLPTEEEWAYAARGGTTTDHYWGNGAGSGLANCEDCGSDWADRETAPVGSFSPNPYGLYDMLGNVWQWTDDCLGKCTRYAVRGGSWAEDHRFMRISVRAGHRPTVRSESIGFRLVRVE